MGSAGARWTKRRWRVALRSGRKEVEVIVNLLLETVTAVPLIGRNEGRNAMTDWPARCCRSSSSSSSWGRRRRLGAAQRDEAADSRRGRQRRAEAEADDEAEWS